jgi:hypothetical protein
MAFQVVEDPALAQQEKVAEKRREEAFSAEPMWNGRPLIWSISRESLFYAQRHAVGARDISEVIADIDAFFADAIRILWLCTHTPDDWRGLRTDLMGWQETMEKWADENITTKQKSSAVLTAWKILENTWEVTHETAKEPGARTQGKP